jgi:hypothetical protein
VTLHGDWSIEAFNDNAIFLGSKRSFLPVCFFPYGNYHYHFTFADMSFGGCI